jgi:hypothetical protein
MLYIIAQLGLSTQNPTCHRRTHGSTQMLRAGVNALDVEPIPIG